jgi:nitrite reductase (NADH) small subunit
MWRRIASVNDLAPGQCCEIVIDDHVIALFNVAGEFFALDGICPHQGGPLGKGTLQGCVVTCPWHGWQFDVRTGQHQASAALSHPAFPTKVEEEVVWVRVPEA